MSPHGGTLVPRVEQLCLGINVPCRNICLGIIVRGTAMPRHECPGGGGGGGGTTMPTTPVIKPENWLHTPGRYSVVCQVY